MMRRKIHFIHHFMQPGGVERQLYYLVNGLAGYHDVTILLCERKGSFLDFIDQRVSIMTLDTRYKHRLQLGLFAGMMKILKKDRPDIFISFHGSFHWLAVLAGRLLGIRVVCVFHGYMQKGLLWPAHRFMLHLADGLIAVSQSVKNSMSENLRILPEKITVIENAIDEETICSLSKEALNPYEQQLIKCSAVIVSIGRLAKGKGFDIIVNALSRINKEFLLLIIGDGPEKSNIESLIRNLGLSDKVFLLGNQINPYKFLKSANFFVLASESEGLPTVILEAMCLNVPCICTNYLGGTEGVISDRENGYLVNANDPQDLARVIEMFLSSEAKATLEIFAERSKVLINKKFGLRRYKDNYLTYLENIYS